MSGPVVILGGGLAGLGAAHALAAAGREVLVLEAGDVVGGLSRTETFGDFRFDLGGHRFFTHDAQIAALVQRLLGDELIDVPRSSTILLRGRYVDYPLRPANALAALGPATTARVVGDWLVEQVRAAAGRRPDVSLEDWVVRRFGRTLFSIYFKEYSEKVWGLPCDRISVGWVARRIEGLSLGRALRDAFTREHRGSVASLVDRFAYPRLGIGRLAERFAEELAPHGRVLCGARVTGVRHEGGRVRAVTAATPDGERSFAAGAVIATIPLPALARLLDPPPTAEALAAAAALGFRDLVLAAVAADRPTITDQSWIYLPDRTVPFGRLHEPKNWSRAMAPPERSLVVAEWFCSRGDAVWEAGDGELAERTVAGLERLGYLGRGEVTGVRVLRIPAAYPLFDVGYERRAAAVREGLAGIGNLLIAGRSGCFAYQNMDHAIRSGLDAARALLRGENGP
ncbi:MAG TPA: FAD-dependent oxidoreductase [Candidatus Methanoperedens sp.]|nr:FAD-dependent oxidoreductase [Candidatus Methanoperedens sp.]